VWTVPEDCTKLDVSKSRIGPAEAERLANALLETPVKSLKCSFNNIGDGGVAWIAEVVKENSNVFTKLELASTGISADGMALLGEALKSNTYITHLDVSGNDFGDAGAAAVAEVLKVNSAITLIGLHQNKIGDAGASALATGLETNHKLKNLGLNKNGISNAGATALAAAALLPTTALTTLKLEHNKVGNSGTSALAETLIRPNAGLKTLKIGGNKFGGLGAEAIKRATAENPDAKVSLVASTLPDEEPTSEVPYLAPNQVGLLEGSLRDDPSEFAFIKYDTANCPFCKVLDKFWDDLAAQLPPGRVWRISCEAEPELCHERSVHLPGEPVFEAWGTDVRRSKTIAVERFQNENRGTQELMDFYTRKVQEAQAQGGAVGGEL
jgi:hypothetical protein